jgi:hypothetical protein
MHGLAPFFYQSQPIFDILSSPRYPLCLYSDTDAASVPPALQTQVQNRVGVYGGKAVNLSMATKNDHAYFSICLKTNHMLFTGMKKPFVNANAMTTRLPIFYFAIPEEWVALIFLNP